VDDVESVARRTRNTVQLCHDHDIAGSEDFEQFGQFRTVIRGFTAGFLGKDPNATIRVQSFNL
jgi:hypothetical protein